MQVRAGQFLGLLLVFSSLFNCLALFSIEFLCEKATRPLPSLPRSWRWRMLPVLLSAARNLGRWLEGRFGRQCYIQGQEVLR